jgi:phage terminase small subunit
MGSRGPLPRRDSSESRRGRNTYRARPVRLAVDVSPPPTVAADPVALTFWHEHADKLVAAGRLRPEFADTFGLLAVMVAECRAMTDRMNTEGILLPTRRGSRPNPLCRMIRDRRRDIVTLLREFGLTPVSDARLPANTPEGTDGNDDVDAVKAARFRAFIGG